MFPPKNKRGNPRPPGILCRLHSTVFAVRSVLSRVPPKTSEDRFTCVRLVHQGRTYRFFFSVTFAPRYPIKNPVQNGRLPAGQGKYIEPLRSNITFRNIVTDRVLVSNTTRQRKLAETNTTRRARNKLSCARRNRTRKIIRLFLNVLLPRHSS